MDTVTDPQAAQQTRQLIPEVYILWHRKFPLGHALASRIFRWLRPGNGFGPDVFYRSLPAPGADENGLPPPLPHENRPGTGSEKTLMASSRWKGSDDNRQIVLALVDEQLVADYAWRHWLESLVLPDTSTRIVLPVALSPVAYNLPDKLRELNFLRPGGPPLDGVKEDSDDFETVVRSLLKQVTEVMCRELLPLSTNAKAGSLPKVNVFLSHAKADGLKPARRLRDYIYSQTQLSAFFDENDIAFGSAFGSVITNSVKQGETAALIAVRSAHYSRRPWCRREFSLFRNPVEAPTDSRNWRLFPALIVEAMDGRELSHGIPEMGNCPIIRWTESDQTLEELVITTLIRDAMLASFHSMFASSFKLGKDELAINWLPDPTTLLQLAPLREHQPCQVYYPGRGIPGQELDVLQTFFPKATFTAFEQRS